MTQARRRPPRLDDPVPGPRAVAAPPTAAERLVRARVAGRSTRMGPSELRRLVERIAAGDRSVLGGLVFEPVDEAEVAQALRDQFGAWRDVPTIDAACTLAACELAAARLAAAARSGARVLCASARPATLLGLHLRLAAAARSAGASIPDERDSGELRVDGRRARRLRTLAGVTVVTDGSSLLAVDGPEPAEELRFLVPSPALVVADGAFATTFGAAGLPVVAFGGLELLPLAVAAARGAPVTVVPVDETRPPAAYAPVAEIFEAALG